MQMKINILVLLLSIAFFCDGLPNWGGKAAVIHAGDESAVACGA
jgi:hypothetical protein